MPPKKKKEPQIDRRAVKGGHIEGAGQVVEQPITATLRENYMPYAMSVIVSRAIPEIDGFKPSHRKLLYTMYKEGLLSGSRVKSANIVGRTMRLNPHGDAAIYETMVRLARGNESLLVPYVDSKGNFGKAYSRDMAYAAPRYTEAKLEKICTQLFADIDKDTVDFVDNYDNSMKEPTLLPVTFPTVLVNNNTGIAVGMASNICSFNLAEVCETTAKLIRDPDHDIVSTLIAPDFSGGGYYLYDEQAIRQIYETGRGSFRIRSKYRYDAKSQRIEVTEIPASTSIEAIIEKIQELIKLGKLREVSTVRDESDKNGLMIALELKRGTDGEQLMQRLFRLTPLEDSFSCNFTVLIKNQPMLLGVRQILSHWIDFRRACVRRRTAFDLKNRSARLHLLEGLSNILLDIDKAIKIIRETEQEREVVPNLMLGFGIDRIQAEYVAEIKLRYLNREYLLNRLGERDRLEKEIAELKRILGSEKLIDSVIISELKAVADKYRQERRTKVLYTYESDTAEEEETIPDYPVNLFFTREGYFKKITPQSLRMSGEQKLKEGDAVITALESTNAVNLLFFTNRQQVYKARAADFDDTKASAMGDYVAAKLKMDAGETAISMVATRDFKGYSLVFYKNGKVAKVPLSSFETKLNRRKLQKAYSASADPVAILGTEQDADFAISASSGRLLIVSSSLIPERAAKDTVGVSVMVLKKGAIVTAACPAASAPVNNAKRFASRKIPSAGAIVRDEDVAEQTTMQL